MSVRHEREAAAAMGKEGRKQGGLRMGEKQKKKKKG